MKVRTRKKPFARGSVEKVRDSDLGHGLRLEVHKLTPPRDPEILSRMERARAASARGDTDVAADLAREIWQRAQGDKFVEVWVGQMLAKYGDREEAVEVYCASEGLERGSWQAYWQLGRFLLMAGLHARAAAYAEEAVRIEPRAIDAHLDLARCFMELGRVAEAQQHLNEARQLDPKAML